MRRKKKTSKRIRKRANEKEDLRSGEREREGGVCKGVADFQTGRLPHKGGKLPSTSFGRPGHEDSSAHVFLALFWLCHLACAA